MVLTLTAANPIPLAAPCRNAVSDGQSCGGERHREMQGDRNTHSDNDDLVCERVNVLRHLVQVRSGSLKSRKKMCRVDAIEENQLRRRNQANCPHFTRSIVRCKCCKDEQRKLQGKVGQGPAEKDVQNGITMRANYQQQGLRKGYADATATNYRTTEDRRNHKKSSDMLLGEEESEAKRDEAG